MYVVLGATGHVGSAVTAELLNAGQEVTAVIHSPDTDHYWRKRGARTAVVDVRDSDALRHVFRTGRRAFLLNPPADVRTDTDNEEHATMRGIVEALDGSGLEKVVVASTYGAQPGDRCGDLNILYDFEQMTLAQPIPATVQRAAYYMSNWDPLLQAAKGGTLPTMLPVDLHLPMVSPTDVGKAAVRRLQEAPKDDEIHHVEGPERYSPRNVANAFAEALGTTVEVVVTPREQWIEAYRKLGFSHPAAVSYARMTAATVDNEFVMSEPVDRGEVALQAYITELVQSERR